MRVERIKEGPLRIILTEQNDIFNLRRGNEVCFDLEKKILDGLTSVRIEPGRRPATHPEVLYHVEESSLVITIGQGYPLNNLNKLMLDNGSEEFYKKYGTHLKFIVI